MLNICTYVLAYIRMYVCVHLFILYVCSYSQYTDKNIVVVIVHAHTNMSYIRMYVVCVYICTYVYTYTHIHMYVCTYIYVQVSRYTVYTHILVSVLTSQ